MHVLIIEPDITLAQTLELLLKGEGFNVSTTGLGEEGIYLARNYDYDLILLEPRLPDILDFDVLRSLRAKKIVTPIMILSEIITTEVKVRALSLGADDYLCKPFHTQELIARMHAIVRRSMGYSGQVITVGPLSINIDSGRAFLNGNEMHLPPKEYQVLKTFCVRGRNKILSRQNIFNHIYEEESDREIKIIDVYISKLRKKIGSMNDGNCLIETFSRRGYLLRDGCTTESSPLTEGSVAAE